MTLSAVVNNITHDTSGIYPLPLGRGVKLTQGCALPHESIHGLLRAVLAAREILLSGLTQISILTLLLDLSSETLP